VIKSMVAAADFSMIRLMASAPPVLTPVGVEIDQELNPKPSPAFARTASA